MSDEMLDLICELRFGRKPLKRAQRMKVADMLERASGLSQSALLDRVRSECLIEYPSRANPAYEDGPTLSTMLTVDGPPDVLRQFAERLKQD